MVYIPIIFVYCSSIQDKLFLTMYIKFIITILWLDVLFKEIMAFNCTFSELITIVQFRDYTVLIYHCYLSQNGAVKIF